MTNKSNNLHKGFDSNPLIGYFTLLIPNFMSFIFLISAPLLLKNVFLCVFRTRTEQVMKKIVAT